MKYFTPFAVMKLLSKDSFYREQIKSKNFISVGEISFFQIEQKVGNKIINYHVSVIPDEMLPKMYKEVKSENKKRLSVKCNSRIKKFL